MVLNQKRLDSDHIQGRIFYNKSVAKLEQVAQSGCRWLIPGNIQHYVGQLSDRPDLVNHVPAHCRIRWPLKVPPNPKHAMILWFYVFCSRRWLSHVPKVSQLFQLTRWSVRSARAHYWMGDSVQAMRAAAAMDSVVFARVACRSVVICYWGTGDATNSPSQHSGD